MKQTMRSALSIGNFDGVHRGHRALIESLFHWKRQSLEPVKSIVMTFDPHPAEIIASKKIPRITLLKEKIDLLYSLGVDEVRVIPFTTELSQLSARRFFDEHILSCDPSFISIGQNFYFGKNREGSSGKILDWAREKGIEVNVMPPVNADGFFISSSRIRELIHEGNMVATSRLLGSDFQISGEVMHGDKRGRLLGFPTANLIPQDRALESKCLPARGVYLTSSLCEGRIYPSITNVGVKPTVSSKGDLVVESHLLGFDGDLYGKWLTVEFRDRIRAEMKFSGLDELKQQIQKDSQFAREKLGLK